MAVATRMNAEGLRSSLRTAFAAMWTIEGMPGIFQYVSGVKKGYEAKEGEILAEVSGAVSLFKKDEVVMEVLSKALGVELPA